MYLYISKKRLLCIGILMLAIIIGLGMFVKENKTPTIAPEPIYQGDDSKKQVSFAINVDWGEEYIPDMLNTLNKNNVKATFFLTGRWTTEHEDIAKTIYNAGHEIGNHGYSHKSPNAMNYEDNKKEIKDTQDAINKAILYKTQLYAPPSGESESHVLEAANDLGYKSIMWTIDTIDWQKPSVDVMISRIDKKLVNGSIILMHPTENTAKGLDSFIQLIKSKEYDIVIVSENIN